MWETQVHSLGWEVSLEKEMATHSSILSWEIPWTEEPGGLQSMGHKELDTTEHTYTHAALQIQRTNGPLLITTIKKLILHTPVTRSERNRSLEGLSLAINCSE